MNTISVGLFAKYPVPGEVKTRLTPALGEVGAAAFAKYLLFSAIERVRDFQLPGWQIQPLLWVSGGSQAQWLSLLKKLDLPIAYEPEAGVDGPTVEAGLSLLKQSDGHLGLRMRRALGRQLGFSKMAMLLGTDCVGFEGQDFCDLANAAQTNGMAFTEALDGGYVAVACSEIREAAFVESIEWGSHKVAEQTRDQLNALGQAAIWLPPKLDIDEPADYEEAISLGLIPENWMEFYRL